MYRLLYLKYLWEKIYPHGKQFNISGRLCIVKVTFDPKQRLKKIPNPVIFKRVIHSQ